MGISNINYIELKNCIVDEIHLRENVYNINLSSTKDDWQFDTFLLAKFQNSLEAGNISLGGLPIDGFRIRRRRIDTTKLQDLGIIPLNQEGQFYFVDTGVRSGVTYEYQVSPVSGNIEGQPILVQIAIDFDYWWISDATYTTNESYPIFANIEISDIVINKQRYTYEDTFNKYPIVSYGNQQYKSGTITALLIDSFMKISTEYRQKVIDFINNGKPKYLRTNEGDIWLVDTHTCSYKPFTNLIEPLSSITFSFMEVGEAE